MCNGLLFARRKESYDPDATPENKPLQQECRPAARAYFQEPFSVHAAHLVSNLFQQLYNTVDTMIVGNVLGDTALAAIGSCGSIYELLVGFGIGIGNGLSIVAARSYGAQDEDLLKRTVAGSLVIGLCASFVITTAGFFGLRPLLQLLDTPRRKF